MWKTAFTAWSNINDGLSNHPTASHTTKATCNHVRYTLTSNLLILRTLSICCFVYNPQLIEILKTYH